MADIDDTGLDVGPYPALDDSPDEGLVYAEALGDGTLRFARLCAASYFADGIGR